MLVGNRRVTRVASSLISDLIILSHSTLRVRWYHPFVSEF